VMDIKAIYSYTKASILDSFYAEEYSDSINEIFWVRMAHSIPHKELERRHRKSGVVRLNKPLILELGGGNGEHIKYVQQDFEKYIVTDLRKIHTENLSKKIIRKTMNAEAITFQDNSFDRVIVTCLLHHLSDPWECIREINRVLKPKGQADIFIPCDPGIIFRLFRNVFFKAYFRKHNKKKYKILLDALDHQNHCGSLIKLCQYGFQERKVKLKYYPFGIKLWNLNLFVIIQVS
jgi:phosphatidylethanolamine/phosphatidyl-N-methylethanolamine N-methyltransferase